jgi:hypothetical protein
MSVSSNQAIYYARSNLAKQFCEICKKSGTELWMFRVMPEKFSRMPKFESQKSVRIEWRIFVETLQKSYQNARKIWRIATETWHNATDICHISYTIQSCCAWFGRKREISFWYRLFQRKVLQPKRRVNRPNLAKNSSVPVL